MPDLDVQIALRNRLVASSDVTDLVPPLAILDRNSTPAPRPGIVLGESQVLDTGDSLARDHTRIVHTIHVWKTEPSREGVKRIMGAIRAAVTSGRLDLGPDLHCVDINITSMRAMSDPDGETSHGVVTVDVLVARL